MDQNVDFSGDDQIQNPQYPNVQENSLTNDEFEAYTNANDANMNDLQFKLDNFQKNQQDFQEKFEQMQDDLLNQMRNFMQNLHDGPPGEEKEPEATTDTELTSTEDIQPLPNQEPPQDSDIRQLIREEYSTEVSEKQKIEYTMLELVKICQEKEFLCIHDDIDDLIESALDSKLLLINLNSQRLDKKEQEVKNIVEQPAERGNRNIQSLQNFKVVHKSSISFNTSQISSIHSIAPIKSTKELEHLLSMGITPETESDEVTESNADNLLPIPIYNDDFEDIEYVEASLFNPKNVSIEEENSVEEENVVKQEEDVNFEDISQIQDVFLREKLLSITRLISNIESLNDNSTPDQTRSGNTTYDDNSLPEYDLFCFEIEPDQERLIILVLKILLMTQKEIHFLEELLIDYSILSHELFNSNFEDNPSIPRPPPEPPDAETDAGEETLVVMNDKDKFDDDYQFFMFDKVFSLSSLRARTQSLTL
nr:hypothetical protein [Tanacetum cinerariifolium]